MGLLQQQSKLQKLKFWHTALYESVKAQYKDSTHHFLNGYITSDVYNVATSLALTANKHLKVAQKTLKTVKNYE
jgi:hypothetical protein